MIFWIVLDKKDQEVYVCGAIKTLGSVHIYKYIVDNKLLRVLWEEDSIGKAISNYLEKGRKQLVRSRAKKVNDLEIHKGFFSRNGNCSRGEQSSTFYYNYKMGWLSGSANFWPGIVQIEASKQNTLELSVTDAMMSFVPRE